MSGSDEGRGAGGRPAGAAAEGEGVFGEAEAGWGCWLQGVGGPCSSPGSSPDCALGLTP